MRSIIAVVSLVVLLLTLGCNLAPHHRNSVGRGGVAVNTATPTVDNLVEYLNKNADCIKPDQALTCTNVMINAAAERRGRVSKVGVDCKMRCQAPRHFRLTGVTLGQPVVEIGSNDKEFWFWSREIEPPYLYHCSYDDLARGVNVPFPFQPDMALNALGLTRYDRNKNYTMRIVDDNKGRHKAIELTEQARSLDNKPIQKVTVFDFHQAQPPQPQVIAHILKDQRGKVICAANIHSAQRVGGDNGPIIPRIVDFNWPEQKMTMEMRIENPTLIAMPPQKAAMIFNRQGLTWQSFDLAKQALDGAGVQQAGAAGTVYRP